MSGSEAAVKQDLAAQQDLAALDLAAQTWVEQLREHSIAHLDQARELFASQCSFESLQGHTFEQGACAIVTWIYLFVHRYVWGGKSVGMAACDLTEKQREKARQLGARWMMGLLVITDHESRVLRDHLGHRIYTSGDAKWSSSIRQHVVVPVSCFCFSLCVLLNRFVV